MSMTTASLVTDYKFHHLICTDFIVRCVVRLCSGTKYGCHTKTRWICLFLFSLLLSLRLIWCRHCSSGTLGKYEMTREKYLISCIYHTEIINEGATKTRTTVVGFPSKYSLAEMPTPNILAIQRAFAPTRAVSLQAFGGLSMKCSICGEDDAANICSTVVAYRATNRDRNAVEIGCYGFFGYHRAEDEHQSKHQTLIVSERFICVCNDHHCLSEARTKRTQGKKFGQVNDMVFTLRCAIEPIGLVLAHLRGGEEMKTRIHSASSKENECGNNPVDDAYDGVSTKEMK